MMHVRQRDAGEVRARQNGTAGRRRPRRAAHKPGTPDTIRLPLYTHANVNATLLSLPQSHLLPNNRNSRNIVNNIDKI